MQIGQSPLPFIQDRTIYEDARSSPARCTSSSMTEGYANYTSLFGILASFLRRPDRIVYLKASPESLMSRIARRGRASEQGIGIDYISRLNRAYDDWMRRARSESEVLEIDTDRVPLQGETDAFKGLVEDLKRRFPRQAELRLEE